MIDIVMFDRITKALPDSARLILLGDPEQLPSVENGAVLTDLCSLDPGYDQVFSGLIERNLSIECPIVEGKPHKLTNSFCRLYKNYRFSDDKGIGALASAIRHRKPIDFSDNDEVSFISEFTVDSLIGDIMRHYQNYLELTKTEADAELLLEAFDQHRILTPVREGQFGVSALNEAISGILHSDTEADTHYHGKPVMITKNDYNLRRFNGDIGICVKNSKGDMEVAFKGEDGEILYYLVSRLPAFETCFVMTVHKAQGSEFDQVSLVLPENEKITDDLITHELIYTGITRTRSHITIYARPDYLSACLDNYSSRLSCLTNRFTELPDNDKDQRLEQMDLF